jgi:hypothetical protein
MFCKGNERRAQWQMKTKISLDMAEPHLTLSKGIERRAQWQMKNAVLQVTLAKPTSKNAESLSTKKTFTQKTNTLIFRCNFALENTL